MSILSKLFGKSSGSKAPAAASEDYEGYRITPQPIKEGNSYRVAARIEKGEGEALKVHNLIRADTVPTLEGAVTLSANKAKQMIDQMGDKLFG